MQRDPRAWLWDVREAITAIESFVAGLDATGYAQSALVHSAVERKFEVIGEALNQLSKTDAAMASKIPHLPQIVAFRNQLIHGYAMVDHATVWGVIEYSLPALRAAVESLLQPD
ncbi:HepT-like ribonuclease domain-containing protein [Ramlibacter tataouinensis]|uniref:DUF86 domain-containing protein n=1 Tax=Ramlibacter tataouinensis (strain ATCC BAA-407 / DSM 14655 / LMG 21543 / TTB310) TaxID=365046 RepID=F5Y2A4_RAMTT|nr:HepT-like ribonuclease domain-containing protein [Ramlibacter tataouinensis]AEG91078.1 conserved Hypothetical protein [Ramlibacter tataouinensis TTB310]